MQTGYYARHATHPHAVAISAGVPWWYGGRRYPALAPKREWLWLPEEAYREQFAAKLRGMNAQKVVADLGEDAVLLCWEAPGRFCHRRLVAEWIERETGIAVPEAAVEEAEGDGPDSQAH